MATGSTVYSFEIALSDSTRDVYESLSLKVARHSSETLEYLICRVLAYSLEFTEGLEFSKGLSDPEFPALWVRDLTGKLTHWIEIGSPSAEKIHKASKSVARVAIYTHKNPALLIEQLSGKDIFRKEEIGVHALKSDFISEIAALTEKRNIWALSISEKSLYLDIGKESYTTEIETYQLT